MTGGDYTALTPVVPGAVLSTWGTDVRDSVVLRFASAAARDSALSSLTSAEEGMIAYIKDVDQITLWNGTRWVPIPGTVIARGTRPSTSTTTTSEVGVLWIPAAVKAGQLYSINTCGLLLYSTTARDTTEAALRYTTDGSTPTTSSTRLATIGGYVDYASSSIPHRAFYVPTSDCTLKVLLTVGRAAGSGTVSMVASSNYPTIDLTVIAHGKDQGNVGTNI